QYFGLFKQIGASGIIRNVVFDNGIISSGTQHSGSKVYVGLLAGANKGLVEGIQIRNSSISVHRSISNTGGIVGHNSGIIRNSLNSNGTLFINGSAGSIAGVNMDGGLISRCTARDMNITYYGTEVSQSVGGLLGYNYKSTLEYSNVYNMTMTYDGVNSLVPRMGYVLGNLHDGTIREIGVDSSTGATNSSFKSLVSLKKSDGVFGIGNYDFTTYFFAKYNKMVGRVQGTNVVA
ncbi:MAG: hypothetical protein Q8M70_03430, partial [bacterium]|nr:hypothetical protein [bacterium]